MKVILLVTVSKDKDVFFLLLRYKLKIDVLQWNLFDQAWINI